jgi:malonate transporter
MAIVVAALLPVFILIVLGLVLKRSLMRLETQWHGLERLTYYVLFPMLLIQTLVKANLSKVAGVGGALLISALAMSLLCLGLRLARPHRHRRAGLHLDLPGRDALADLCRACGVRQSLWRHWPGARLRRDGGDHSAGQRVQRRGARPLRLAGKTIGPRHHHDGGAQPADLGLCHRPARQCAPPPLPKIWHEVADALGHSSLAIGLLVTGAGLQHLEGLFRPNAGAAIGVCLKLLAMPAIAVALALPFGLTGADLVIVSACAAVPASSSAYVLARQMGGDAPLLAQIITLQTILAALTMPIAIALVA